MIYAEDRPITYDDSRHVARLKERIIRKLTSLFLFLQSLIPLTEILHFRFPHGAAVRFQKLVAVPGDDRCDVVVFVERDGRAITVVEMRGCRSMREGLEGILTKVERL